MGAWTALAVLAVFQPVFAADSRETDFAEISPGVENELRENILSFWLTHTRDPDRGGFYGEISADLEIDKGARRGSLLTSRVLWTFSAAYRIYGDPAYLEMATWAYDDLVKRFWDEKHGGLFFETKANGRVSNDEKITYMQAFGIYGFSEYHRATGNADAFDRAIALFHKLEEHAYDPEHGGYFEGFDRDWSDMGWFSRPAINPRSAKSQNTLLHVMEAYTNLLRIWPNEKLKVRQKELVDVMMTRVLNTENNHLHLFLGSDWTPESEGISYGHDIEFSWLLTEAAELSGDKDLIERAKKVAVAVAEATFNEAIDEDGAILYEANPDGVALDIKEWWAQSEATVGFLNAYQITGDEKFLHASLNTWSFIQANLVDKKNGEWFGRISRDRSQISPEPKVHFWKAPYHNSRGCMEMLERFKELQKED